MAQTRKVEAIAALASYGGDDDDELDEGEGWEEEEDVGLSASEKNVNRPQASEPSAPLPDRLDEGTALRRENLVSSGILQKNGVLGLSYGAGEVAGASDREDGEGGDEEEGAGEGLREEAEQQRDDANGAATGGGAPRERPRTPTGGTVSLLTSSNPSTEGSKASASPLSGAQPEGGGSRETLGEGAASRPAAEPLGEQGATNGTSGERTPPGGGLEDAGTANGAASPMQVDGARQNGESSSDVEGFLPPRPPGSCSIELQAKFTKFLELKRQGQKFNDALRMSKGYRNPDLMQQLVEKMGIDEIGSCFPKSIFDPHGLNKNDYFDKLVLQQRRDSERKEQERKTCGVVEFQRGGVQLPPKPGPVVQLLSSTGTGAGLSRGMGAAGGSSGTTSADRVARGGEKKRSKWDRTDAATAAPVVAEAGTSEAAGGKGSTAVPPRNTQEAAVAAAKAHAAAMTAAAKATAAAAAAEKASSSLAAAAAAAGGSGGPGLAKRREGGGSSDGIADLRGSGKGATGSKQAAGK
eukprot:TRINITY_DN8222_c0_g1_i2.p1 TRINITY_DN8222_c0_g1~~TRINITY_DN8222_c0_g1_i2.p1  ORF type:complete len:524 (-),score=147.26 TRINITY_DN8222_c0_g1_i2:112-1683(-)